VNIPMVDKWDPKAAGNKGIPEPRAKHIQRKIVFDKLRAAKEKGWTPRLVNNKQVVGLGWILCEKLIEERE
jgi:hypothetical protein